MRSVEELYTIARFYDSFKPYAMMKPQSATNEDRAFNGTVAPRLYADSLLKYCAARQFG